MRCSLQSQAIIPFVVEGMILLWLYLVILGKGGNRKRKVTDIVAQSTKKIVIKAKRGSTVNLTIQAQANSNITIIHKNK